MILERLRMLVGTEVTLRHFAWLSVLGALGLSLLGIYAIDLGSADAPEHGVLPVTLSGYVAKQLMFLTVGIIAAAVVCVPHYRFVRAIAWPAMWIMLGFLIFLLLPFIPASIVTPRNGARAWIDVGPVDFQPAEIAKITFVLVLADYLRYRQNHRLLLGLIPPGFIAFVPIALITLQPDLGTALLFVPALFAMVVAAGARIKHLALIVLIATLAAPAAYPLLKPHQKARIVGLIRMMQDPRQGADDINYQGITAQTLAGAGGLTGIPDAKARSLIRFNRLPERHNDMVLAVIMTRFGLIGALVMVLLYVAWFTGAYLTAALCRDPFARLVVIGCTAFIAAQMFINVGMTIGLLPIIGLTLPFISYGGSSMLTVWLMTGLVVNIAMRRSVRYARPTFEFDRTPYDPNRQMTPQKIVPTVRGR